MLNFRSIGIIGRTYRHVNRYRQILTILFKYGFDNIIDILKIDQYLEVGLQMISRKKREKVERLTPQERVRLIFEELGPTFIKFGQILSTRPDLIPLPFIHELEKLQDNVPAFSFSEVKSILSSEFKSRGSWSLGSVSEKIGQNSVNFISQLSGKLDNPFESIEETPFASASIGQVHRAVLKTGEKVAVKIQRPGIKKLIEVDLEILLHLATLMERHIEDLSFFKPVKIVQEFAATLERELDYTLEASNIIRVERQFPSNNTSTNISHNADNTNTTNSHNNSNHSSKNIHGIYIPKVYLEHTTSSILTMEYVDGIKISEIETLDAKGYDRKLLTKRGADFILTQVLEYGFFHADLHPGNIFVLPDNVLCPIDFGIMGYVDQYTREVFVDIIASTVMQNISQVSRLLLELTDYDEEPNLRALERDVAGFTGHYFAGSMLKEINIGKMLQDIVQIALNHRLRILPETFLMLKAFTAVEGVATMIYPEFNMISHAAPYIKKAKMARFSPARISDDMSRVTSESIKLLQSLPRESLAIIRQLRKGKLTIGFDIQRLEKILSANHQANNRISISIIIAALILASSLLLCFAVPPLILGLSLLGVAGLACAIFIGFMLVISIFKQ
ncbi:MAG: AarF/ABC1/UbiB kinase family protein [Desulfamplus sp.]|nr:AarF/ABC1/UbiB kinase family protein [Desulfamplus sp.]